MECFQEIKTHLVTEGGVEVSAVTVIVGQNLKIVPVAKRFSIFVEKNGNLYSCRGQNEMCFTLAG